MSTLWREIQGNGTGLLILILICGSRVFRNKSLIQSYIDSLREFDVVMHGGARGADSLAGYCATQKGLEVKDYTLTDADWRRYGRGAGFKRNKEMLKEGPELVVYFSDDLQNSKGTKHMVSLARKANIVVLANPNGSERCHSQKDGECDWTECPQKTDYQIYCPFAKTTERDEDEC